MSSEAADAATRRVSLIVTIRENVHRLTERDVFTFGRLETCTVCLDPVDRGISRIAGAILFEHGVWWVVNRSSSRALHIVDSVGFSVPLPVTTPGWPSSSRAIDPGGLRVLVAGHVWMHEIRCEHASTIAQPAGHVTGFGQSTQSFAPSLTDARKEVLIALVVGYLEPFPRYDPRPRTYGEIAEMLGLPASTPRKRIEAVRNQLREGGYLGLDHEDCRRPLAELLLSTRVIVPDDLLWLRRRIAERAAEQSGSAAELD